MKKIVADSSVVIKWFVVEPYSTRACRILNQYQKGKINLLAPDFINAEIYEPENFPSLPDFRVPNRKELESLPLPSLQQNEAVWDMLTQEFTTFEEQFEASLQEVDKLAEAAQEKLREVKKPQEAEKIVGAKKRKAENIKQ